MIHYDVRRLCIPCIVILSLCLLTQSIPAQDIRAVNDLENAAALSDQQGFGGTTAVDGRLSVSAGTGGVMYSYPISRQSLGGHSIDTRLNYCGAVSSTAYIGYNKDSVRWVRFTQNRPAWIIGVNGFAIQVLGYTDFFHRNPAWNYTSTRSTSYTDSDLLWTIDGYDVCNRMRDLTHPNAAAGTGGVLVDEINLLRSDGSVLRLQNLKSPNATPAKDRPEVYTGHYYENEPNASGFGVVEFDSTYWTNHIARYGRDSGYAFIPRRLSYYPGDGLEYVFREWIVPYGIDAYRLDGPDAFLGKRYGPTVFYLEKINVSTGASITFSRNRHKTVDSRVDYIRYGIGSGGWRTTTDSLADSSRGRALISAFDGHRIVYSLGDRQSVSIEALGRTTTIWLDSIRSFGDGTAHFYDAWSGSRLQYKGFLGYVTAITDPVNRTTAFGYSQYVRRYAGFGFPSTGHDTVTLRNYRLTTVTEPAGSYAIAYRDTNLCIEADTALVKLRAPPVPMLVNNVIDSIRRLAPNGSLLATTKYSVTYRFTWPGVLVWTTDSTRVTSTDNVTGATGTTTYYYRPFVVPLTALYSRTPLPRMTALYRVVSRADSVTTIEQREFCDSCQPGMLISPAVWGTPYLIMPLSSWTMVNGVRVSLQKYSYDVGTVRSYGGDTAVQRLLGQGVLRSAVRTYRPDDTTAVLFVDSTDYLNLPLVKDTAITRIDTTWDADYGRAFWASTQGYDEWTETTTTWESSAFASAFPDGMRTTTKTTITLAPVTGIPTNRRRYDGSGTFLGGYRARVETGVQQSGGSRGSVLTDSVVAIGGVQKKHLGTYSNTRLFGKSVPSRATNANGARSQVYLTHKLPDRFSSGTGFRRPEGKVLANNDTVRNSPLGSAGEYFSYYYEAPITSRVFPRRYTSLGLLVSDTLTTFIGRSYFGNVDRIVGPNGWLSTTRFDANGRPTLIVRPGDFTDDSVASSGAREIDLVPITQNIRDVDTIHCRIGGSWTENVPTDSIRTAGRLYLSNLPLPTSPQCYCAEDRAKGGGVHLMQTCEVDTPKVVENWNRGLLVSRLGNGHLLLAATTIDSVFLKLRVASLTASTATLRILVPRFGFTQTYVFNWDTTSGWGTSVVPFMVDLTALKDSLLTLALQDSLEIQIELTMSGAEMEFVADAEDGRPKLVVVGSFVERRDIAEREADYTASIEYDDAILTSTANAKVDDQAHSFGSAGSVFGADGARRSRAGSRMRPDGSVRNMMTIGNPAIPVRIDSIVARFTGHGAPLVEQDELGDTVALRYDAAGRPTRRINEDGSFATLSYRLGTPAQCGVTDSLQDFLGFCSVVVATGENGMRGAAYSDALGRLRREVADSTAAGLLLMTRYEYNEASQLELVITPSGDSIRYAYDIFGRVRSVDHPDMGVTSYAYDAVGNLRFSQTQQQANDRRLTFQEYDDLDRLVVAGEAAIDTIGGAPPGGSGHVTDLIDAEVLATGATPSILTANKTLWMDPSTYGGGSVPTFWNFPELIVKSCTLATNNHLKDTRLPVGPFMRHAVQDYEPLDTPRATSTDFEHLAKFPHFIRIATSYDRLPEIAGPIWAAFPARTVWDSLAPHRSVRNGSGRAVAMAYREHGGEPFNYVVLSYDERGRVEAILRHNENLGFDAIYYTYNSADLVTSVRVVDPLRQHATWYGYDFNGRSDSVWSLLGGAGTTGLGLITPKHPTPLARPTVPDIVYTYRKGGQIATVAYPPVLGLVSYAYTRRKLLDSIVAWQGATQLFRERLGYDSSGNVTSRAWLQSAAWPPAVKTERYAYDGVGRLSAWWVGSDTTRYSYDTWGNRVGWTNTIMATTGVGTYGNGTPNRLSGTVTLDQFNVAIDGPNTASFDASGSTIARSHFDPGTGITRTEAFGYSWRDLTRQYLAAPPGSSALTPANDWRYRYSTSAEREQKRLYSWRQLNDSVSHSRAWVYYALGLGKEQLAVYNGLEVSMTMPKAFCDELMPDRVYMYPTEYNTYGNGALAVTTRPDATIASGVKEYRVADALGSTRVILTATTVSESDYLPFGQAVTGLTVGPPSRTTYIGREVDVESEIGDFGFRRHDADEGRFLSVDPLWPMAPGVSPYVYCENDPQNLVDPFGLDGEKPTGREDRPDDAIPMDDREIVVRPRDNQAYRNRLINRTQWTNAPGGAINRPSMAGPEAIIPVAATIRLAAHATLVLARDLLAGVSAALEEDLSLGAARSTYHGGIVYRASKIATHLTTAYVAAEVGMASFGGAIVTVEGAFTPVPYALAAGGAYSFGVAGNALGHAAEEIQSAMSDSKPTSGGQGGEVPVPKGYRETREFGYSNGQKMYRKGNSLISRDVDGHNGGVWKLFEIKGGRPHRVGTAGADLVPFKR
jgi:RHS repeat-associated protein